MMSIDESLCFSIQDLLEQKVEARKNLLELNPEEAQRRVDQVLYPKYWEAIDVSGWEDSLEVDSAETNA
jgi:hypothetical protein